MSFKLVLSGDPGSLDLLRAIKSTHEPMGVLPEVPLPSKPAMWAIYYFNLPSDGVFAAVWGSFLSNDQLAIQGLEIHPSQDDGDLCLRMVRWLMSQRGFHNIEKVTVDKKTALAKCECLITALKESFSNVRVGSVVSPLSSRAELCEKVDGFQDLRFMGRSS